MGCDPTGVLRDEHETILQVVDALETILDRGDGTAELFGDCVDFFRLYADAAHHGKEEDQLFDVLEDRGLSRDAGPLAVMLDEHRRGREYVREMATHVQQLEDDPAPRRRFESVARSYIHHMREHIMKENPSIFDRADQLLDEPACRALCEAYDSACARSFEGRTLAELEELADRINERAAS